MQAVYYLCNTVSTIACAQTTYCGTEHSILPRHAFCMDAFCGSPGLSWGEFQLTKTLAVTVAQAFLQWPPKCNRELKCLQLQHEALRAVDFGVAVDESCLGCSCFDQPLKNMCGIFQNT